MKKNYNESSYYKIIDNIYIGNIWSPKLITKDENITDIVSFIKLPDDTIKSIADTYNYYYYKIENDGDEDILSQFNKMKEFLHTKLFVDKSKILFVCFCGKSCSVAILLLILLEFYNYDFYEAINLIYDKISYQMNHKFYNDIKSVYYKK